MTLSIRKNFHKYTILFAVLLIGIVHGLVYIYVVPPWGHYDEPTHFEYTWMIANRKLLPKIEDMEAGIRRQILESMVENNFYRNGGGISDLSKLEDPVSIGSNQLGDPPIYYWLASIPLIFMKDRPIENQLIATRYVSLLLFLVALVIGRKFSREITDEGSSLRWMIPFSMVLLPALVDLMTANSNDSAAVLVYSLFLLWGVRLIKSGPKWGNILLLSGLIVIGFFTKSSTWLMSCAFIIALIISLFRDKKVLLGWGLVIGMVIAGLFALFEWGDAGLWYRATNQSEPTRVGVALDGRSQYAFQIIDESSMHNSALYQTLVPQDISGYSGMQVTIGAWMWSDRTIEVYPPQVMIVNQIGQKWINPEPVTITQEPKFFAYRVRLPYSIPRGYIVLQPFSDSEQAGKIYYATPVMVLGKYDVKQSPQFSDTDASKGNWGGESFVNLIRNAGATQGWPKFRDYVYTIADKIDYRLAEGLGRVVYTLDYRGTAWYLQSSAFVIFRSFWAKFGWGEISLPGAKPYRVFYIVVMIALIGCLLAIKKKFSWPGMQMTLWLGINICLSLGFALFTGISMSSYIDRAYIPVARFVFPAILAILAILNFGWAFWLELFRSKYRWVSYGVFISLFVILDVFSVITVYRYYWG